MIVTSKQISQHVADENKLSPEMVESIGNVIFQHLRACLNDPQELAYELPELGTFNVRFKKFEQYFNNIKHIEEERNPDNYHRAVKIMAKIEEYRKDKQNVKEKRNKPGEDNAT